MPDTLSFGDYTFPCKPKLHRDNDNELIFCWDYNKEKPTVFSTIKVATAGGEWSVGRGFTFNHILFTEAGMPEYFSGEVINAAMQCVPMNAPVEVWMESSPKGARGPMHRTFKNALHGLNDWKAIYPLFTDHDEYQREPGVGEPTEPVNDFERELVERYKCNVQQLMFARWVVKNKFAEGKDDPIDSFHEEYPVDPYRCWLVQGSMYFPARVVAEGLEQAREYADPESPRYIPIRKVNVHYSPEKTTINNSKFGDWNLIEDPIKLPGHSYAIYGDPASGKRGGNLSVATVWHREYNGKLRNIGYFMKRVSIPKFAQEIYGMWRYFGMPWVIPENNNHGSGLILMLDRLGVHNIWRMRRSDKGKIYPGYEPDYGFITDKYTRPRALSLLTDAMEVGNNNPESRYAIWIPFVTFWDQANSFVFNKAGKPEGEGGINDDFVTNAWMAAYTHFDKKGIQIQEVFEDETWETGQEIPNPGINDLFPKDKLLVGKS